MKANELRIGNWVIIHNAFSKQQNLSQITANWFVSDAYQQLSEPIPLTPEILVKCGFVLVNHIHGYSFYTMDRQSQKDKSKPPIDVYENKTQYMGCLVNHCQYLHQLQNLYFALTGTELEVNI
jgi:hypothetical protein